MSASDVVFYICAVSSVCTFTWCVCYRVSSVCALMNTEEWIALRAPVTWCGPCCRVLMTMHWHASVIRWSAVVQRLMLCTCLVAILCSRAWWMICGSTVCRVATGSLYTLLANYTGRHRGLLTCLIIVIIIPRKIFIVLSSWLQGHCENSVGSYDECRTAPSGRWPSDQATWLGLWVRLFQAAIVYNHHRHLLLLLLSPKADTHLPSHGG